MKNVFSSAIGLVNLTKSYVQINHIDGKGPFVLSVPEVPCDEGVVVVSVGVPGGGHGQGGVRVGHVADLVLYGAVDQGV